MKHYEKIYENVFCTDNSFKKCELSKLNSDDGLNAEEYIKEFKENLFEYEKTIFILCAKIFRLKSRFCYNGKRRERSHCNGFILDSAYGVFLRHHVNTDLGFFKDRAANRLMTYVKSFYPDIEIMSPEEKELIYPYKNIGTSYMTFVYQLPERLELLEYADNNKMSYSQFVDYVINYIYCRNDELGKKLYTFVDREFPYISYKKYEGKKIKASNLRKRKI